jgi:hypothetical protein
VGVLIADPARQADPQLRAGPVAGALLSCYQIGALI